MAHDGHPVSVEFTDRLCRGAINAEHYACHVRHLGQQLEEELLAAANALEAPAAWVSARTDNRTDTVRIRLYTLLGTLLDDTTGLAAIRDLIARDRIPIPVNTQAKGTIEPWPPTSADGVRP
ncbi:hypothetical protein [Streptomyces sp. NPDC005046]